MVVDIFWVALMMAMKPIVSEGRQEKCTWKGGGVGDKYLN